MTQLRRVLIKDLTLGSYVASVTKQKGLMRIKQTGWVRSEQAKQALINKGILEVEVDDDRHYDVVHAPDPEPSDTLPSEEVITTDVPPSQKKNPKSFTTEITRAKNIIQESKRIQRSMILNIQQQNPVEVEQLAYLSDNLVASIERNSNAICCLNRIKNKSAELLEDAIRCTTLMILFAEHRKTDKKTKQALAIGALLHNIGKTKLQDELLVKVGISPQERQEIRTFIEYNAEILNEIEDLPALSFRIATQFKERLDGSGYPNQLDAETLDEYSRMMSIVELYNELTNGKPGQPGIGPLKAYRQMMEMSPTKLDPDLLEQFIKCLGIYPAGTLVRLKSGKVGIVLEANHKHPKRPKVKIFYNAKHQHHVDIKILDLATYPSEEIEACVGTDQYHLDLKDYI